MKTILVPTDFSKEAAHALDFALKLSKDQPSHIVVLNIVQYPIKGFTNDEGEAIPFDDEFARLLDKNIDNKMTVFLGENASKVEAVIEVGNPTISISEYANNQSIDLVIMGSRGSSGMREFIIGSNAERVVRLARCPVIVIKGDTDPKAIKKIVFGTDFKETSADLIKNLKDLQRLFNGHLYLVRINTPNDFRRDEDVHKDIDRFTRKYQLKNYHIDIYNDVSQEEGILSYSIDRQADLIAIGTHGYKGLKHFLAGSLAEKVVNHAEIPIWTYHFRKRKEKQKPEVSGKQEQVVSPPPIFV